MKKIVALLLLCFVSTFAKSQTGLQFNQVRLVEVVLPAASGSVASVGTVPAGKIWKMENILSGIYQLNYAHLQINGNNYQVPNNYSGTTSTSMNNSCIWLPAGTVVNFRRASGVSNPENVMFSILEFTVLP